jgi:ATP-dependent Zn protease
MGVSHRSESLVTDAVTVTIDLTDEELALHEGGHSVIHVLFADTLKRVSIVRDDPSRGVQTTEAARHAAHDETAAHDRIAVLLAGEAARAPSAWAGIWRL